MRPFLLGAASVATGLALLGSAGNPPAPAGSGNRRPSVLLITVDTLRPDALGWVSGRNETPALDALALEGARFPAAVSEVPLTLPSHTSIFTGLLPRRHGVRDNGQVLHRGVRTLAEVLRDSGYSTGAFVSGYPLRALFGLDRGFDRYEDRLPVGPEGWKERTASETVRLALEWVGAAKPPWLLWIHFYDPHDPYEPPRSFWKPGRRGAYDGEVAYVDHEVGRLRRALPAEPTLTLFAADHGEALGEHGEATHGFFVYDSTILVPVVLHFPGVVPPAKRDEAARLIDLMPTALELLGLPAQAGVDGVSLRPLLSGKGQAIPPAYVESRQPWISYGWAPLRAIRHDGWKLVAAPRPELYQMANDPSESSNRYAEERKVVTALAGRMAAVENGPATPSVPSGDPETLAQLRSLGYLGAGGADPEPPRNAADPKDRVEEKGALEQGEVLLRQGRYADALARFDAVLSTDPSNRFAHLRSGISLLKAGRLPDAVARLRKAVLADPNQAECHYALADALYRSGDIAGSVPHWMEVARLQPRRVAAWSNLAGSLARTGEPAKALKAMRQAVSLEPENPVLLENLAKLQEAAGDAAAARATRARTSTSRRPDPPPP